MTRARLCFGRLLGSKRYSSSTRVGPSARCTIGLEQEHRTVLAEFFSALIKGKTPEIDSIAERLLNELPDGIGEAHLVDPGFPAEEAQTVDLKTAIMLSRGRFRLDR